MAPSSDRQDVLAGSSAVSPVGSGTPGDGSTDHPGDRWWRPVLWTLWATSALLVLISFSLPLVLGLPFGSTWWVREFFDVNIERNLPTWWNSGLLLLAGILSAVVGTVRRICRADERTIPTVSWWGLAVVLGLMSLDEFSGFHERLGEVWDRLVGHNPLPAFQGLILGVPLALAVLVLLWVCARSLPLPAARTYLLGMAIFFVGAIAVESVPLFLDIWRRTFAYHVTYHLEELLEFLGAALLVIAPLRALHARRVSYYGPAGVQSICWEHVRR